jgi:PleD family two-component response regulator
MPDFSGLELCKRIRADKSKSYTYMMVMTSNQEKSGVLEAMEAGADDFLVKTVQSERNAGAHRSGSAHHRATPQAGRQKYGTGRSGQHGCTDGIANRRAIEEWANKQLRGAKRHGFPLWVVLGDLDCFQGINDTFGHEAVTRAERTFADTCAN